MGFPGDSILAITFTNKAANEMQERVMQLINREEVPKDTIILAPTNRRTFQVNHIKLGPAKAFYYSFTEVFFVTTSTLKYLGSIITGSGDSSQLGGPIRIAKVTGQVAEFGFVPFLSIMAYISISLGLINLFPIPLLDGGHLMFYGFEKILGRPLTQKTQEVFFRIGMFLLLFLMFFATFNDLKDLGLF